MLMPILTPHPPRDSGLIGLGWGPGSDGSSGSPGGSNVQPGLRSMRATKSRQEGKNPVVVLFCFFRGNNIAEAPSPGMFTCTAAAALSLGGTSPGGILKSGKSWALLSEILIQVLWGGALESFLFVFNALP